MTSFREYREATELGATPTHEVPAIPSDAMRFQGDRAGIISRAVAATIDVILVFLVVLATAAAWWMVSVIIDPISPADAAEGRLPAFGYFVLYGYGLNVMYWTVGWATGGRTIGNLIMGLRVVNFRGQRVRWVGAFVRALFCTLFIPGLLWVVVSGANRSVQDVVLRTSVIYDWVINIPGFRRTSHPAPTPDSP